MGVWLRPCFIGSIESFRAMRAKLNCHQPLKYSNKEYKSSLIKRNRPIVKIIDTVDRAWNATVQEFEKAKVSGEASIWTEDTLRLIFFVIFVSRVSISSACLQKQLSIWERPITNLT